MRTGARVLCGGGRARQGSRSVAQQRGRSIESPTACPNGMTEARIPEAAATAGDLHPSRQGQPERQAGPQADMKSPASSSRQASSATTYNSRCRSKKGRSEQT